MSQFIDSFFTVGRALVKIFFLGAAGFFLSRMNLISEEGFDDLSKVVIYFTLPALIFSNFLGSSKLGEIPNWWIYPLGMAGVILLSLLLGLVISNFLEWPERRQFSALLGFPNTGYLPLALVAALIAEAHQPKAFQLVFLMTLGMTPNMWSIGVALLSGKFVSPVKFLRNVFTSPPFFTILASIGLVIAGWEGYVPELAIETASYAGDVTVPLIMIVLGGMLARVDSTDKKYPKAVGILVLLKLVVYPALGLTAIYLFRPPKILAFVILIEAATPPATNLAVVGSHYGDETGLLKQGLVYSYLAAAVTIPSFISLFMFIY
ncbi:MAG: AEC family transporter [Candidatus Acetothermia bacterium]